MFFDLYQVLTTLSLFLVLISFVLNALCLALISYLHYWSRKLHHWLEVCLNDLNYQLKGIEVLEPDSDEESTAELFEY